MSIFSHQVGGTNPGSQLQRHDPSPTQDRSTHNAMANTFLTSVSKHYESITNTGGDPSIRAKIAIQKPKTQAHKTRNNYKTVQNRGNGNNNDISMASESLEKHFAQVKHDSMPGVSSYVMPAKKKRNIIQEGNALKMIEKRRQTFH